MVLFFRLRRVQFGILLQVLSTLRFLDRFRLSLGSVLFVSVVFVLSHCGFLSLVFTWGLFLVLSPGSAVVLGGPVFPTPPAASPPSEVLLPLVSFCAFTSSCGLPSFTQKPGGSVADFRDYFFYWLLRASVFLLVPRSSSRREKKSVSGACCHAHFLEVREYGEGGGMLSPANFG